MSRFEADQSQATRRRQALRLLAADPLPPVPNAGELLGAFVRRPGELHEAFPLPAPAARWLAQEVARCGVEADVLGSVLLEASLVAKDLALERLAALEPEPFDTLPRGLSAAEADYLRVLTVARRSRSARRAPPQAVIAIPVRLAGRLATVDVVQALSEVAAERALSWEVAALIEGRTLTECVLLHAARIAGYSSACSPGAASRPASRPSKTAS